MTFRIYIGSDNKTGQLDVKAIKAVLNEHFEGWTLERGVGSWKRKEEQTAIITISTDQSLLEKFVYQAKKALRQESIAAEQVNDLKFL